MFERAVSAELLLLIDELSKNAIIREFYLAGGTGLALHLGHRKSMDLDLFSQAIPDMNGIREVIRELSGGIVEERRGTIHSLIRNIKVSFFYYPYPLLEETADFRGLRVARITDIGCMKIIAISQRGEKKDFIDLYEILKIKDISKMKENLIKKYGENELNCYHILKSLFYFEDAENDIDPEMFVETRWEDVKSYFLMKRKEIIELCEFNL